MLISYGAVLVAGIMPVVCAGIAKSGFKGYDNSDPDLAMPAHTTGMIPATNTAPYEINIALSSVGMVWAMS